MDADTMSQDFKSTRHSVASPNSASFEAEAEGLDVEAILERLLGHLPVVTRTPIDSSGSSTRLEPAGLPERFGRCVGVSARPRMAFEEVRPYTPGDEVRFIDWNVTLSW